MKLADEMRAARGEAGARVWWLGQSGFLVHRAGHYLLLDPYLSDSLTRKYAGTDKPHVRICPLAVEPGELDMVEVATSSHNHTDHLDAETLNALRAANAEMRIVVPEANRGFAAARLGCEAEWLVGMNEGWKVEVGAFTFEAAAAAHEALDRTEEGLYPYLGYVVTCAGFTLYHAGDCVLYEGLEEKLRRRRIDLAFLPVNGSLPERRVAGNFWGREAAWLAREMGASLAVPCHYDMFEFNTATPDEFAAECERLGQRYRVMTVGGSLHIATEGG